MEAGIAAIAVDDPVLVLTFSAETDLAVGLEDLAQLLKA
jgi:hypothetical protein